MRELGVGLQQVGDLDDVRRRTIFEPPEVSDLGAGQMLETIHRHRHLDRRADQMDDRQAVPKFEHGVPSERLYEEMVGLYVISRTNRCAVNVYRFDVAIEAIEDRLFAISRCSQYRPIAGWIGLVKGRAPGYRREQCGKRLASASSCCCREDDLLESARPRAIEQSDRPRHQIAVFEPTRNHG